jgi:hypothetical protein
MAEIFPQAQDSGIEKARAELLVFKEENDLKDEKSRDPHWEHIDLNKLSSEEAEIWNSLQAASTPEDIDILMKKFGDYRNKVMAKLQEAKISQPGLDIQKTHEGAMMAWLAGRVQIKIGQLSRNDYFDRR